MEHIPRGGWSWRGSAVVFVLVVAPELALLGIAPELRSMSVVSAVGGLITYAVVLVTGLLVYLLHRLEGGRVSGWVAAVLAIAAVQGMAWSALRLVAPAEADLASPSQLGTDLACMTALLLMLVLARARMELRPDPMALGVGLGLAVGAVRFLLVIWAEPAPVPDAVVISLNTAVLTIVMLAAWLTTRLPELPGWVSSRLALSVVLLNLGMFLAVRPAPAGELGTLTVLLHPIGAVLMCCTALAWLRLSMRDKQLAMARLSDRVHEVEAEVHADRERLHEINGTIAGIASASRLIHQEPSLPEGRAEVLQHMVDCEVQRLERLMNGERDSVESVDLDETLAHVVTAHRILGHDVSWEPSGLWARARADDVAEVVNILLNNAVVHAKGSVANVIVTQADGRVQISVSDTGPGIPPDLQQHIFDWEARSPSSSGQGIGLHIARRLVQEQGGSLRLVEAGRGATFTWDLPAAGARDDRSAS